jgi:hypothetical protein
VRLRIWSNAPALTSVSAGFFDRVADFSAVRASVLSQDVAATRWNGHGLAVNAVPALFVSEN